MKAVAGSSPTPAAGSAGAMSAFDVKSIRTEFPILSQRVHGKPLVYLDNAATSQKPRRVVDALTDYYARYNANVHRGLHRLSELATQAYESARGTVRRFIQATDDREIIFTRGTTEAINLVAQSYARNMLKPGDEVLITTLEHHSNIVPWQIACSQTGAKLRAAPINDRGEILLDEMAKLISTRTKIVACNHVSNALGTINPVRDIIKLAHDQGAVAVIDGAQAAPHLTINVRDLDADFYAISGHKMYAPTGIGALYGKKALLDAMPPWQGGGEMIKHVTLDQTIYNDVPYKFEAGTPNIAGAIGLAAAIDWMMSLDWTQAEKHELDLLLYATEQLTAVQGLRLVGTAAHKTGVLSFIIENQHPYEVGQILDHEGIAIRTGHHCAQPVMDRFGLPATCRASLALYNTREEIDALILGLEKAARLLG